ncbi:Pol protein, partial [Phytophthora palmivora]
MFPPLSGTGAPENVAKALMRPKKYWESRTPTKIASGVGNIVPHEVEETKKKIESAACVSSVGNIVPRGVKKISTSAEVSLSTSRVDNQVPHSESETPPTRSVEEQCHVFDGVSGRHVRAGTVHLEALPEMSTLLNLEELSMKDFLAELKAGEIAEMVLLKPETSPEDLNYSSVMDEDVLEGFTKQRATRLGPEILKNPEDPVYPLVKEYSDVVSKHPPSQLPPDRGVRHEIDLVPGTKYCVTRQWPLPREQCEVINAFFADKAKSGMVRESKSPYSMLTFYVRKLNEKWRLVHVYNRLNNATVPAQTPIPRKDVLLNNMPGCTLYSVQDLIDGYYQILMRESDIPLTAVSTPSGTLWEWLVMPRMLQRRSIAWPHNCLDHCPLKHLRRVFEVMRANKLYANVDKCVFAADEIKVLSTTEEIKVLGCFVSKVGHQDAFDSIKASLQQAPVLALLDENKSFSVVGDASDYAIGCALLQKGDEGHERVMSFQSRQLKAAERNYPVHDKELLAMKYALVKFRVHLLGTRPFMIYTDHASLRTATNPPHLSQRMA